MYEHTNILIRKNIYMFVIGDLDHYSSVKFNAFRKTLKNRTENEIFNRP
ncbi:hypothetical protein ACVWYG_002933 [Pedobacter sp. UYEF25]